MGGRVFFLPPIPSHRHFERKPNGVRPESRNLAQIVSDCVKDLLE